MKVRWLLLALSLKGGVMKVRRLFLASPLKGGVIEGAAAASGFVAQGESPPLMANVLHGQAAIAYADSKKRLTSVALDIVDDMCAVKLHC